MPDPENRQDAVPPDPSCGACVSGVNPWHSHDDGLPPNACPACGGKGTLPGRNWVAQGYVDPNCWHCNGQGVVVPSTQPEWAK